jgi:phospholipase/lecithinase/hemolysin
MSKWILRTLFSLCLLFPLGAFAAKSFSHVFVLGDSLSDTGNVAALSPVGFCRPQDFPTPCNEVFYETSRVTNGPVAAEVLAQRLGFGGDRTLGPSLHHLPLAGLPRPVPFGTDYAVAGARARDYGETPADDLGAQVAALLADYYPAAPSGALYVFIIGANDVRDASTALLGSLLGRATENPQDIIAAAVSRIGDSIRALAAAGASSFLVVNSPNIGALPEVRQAAEELGLPPALLAGLATYVTAEFNKQLARRLDRVGRDQKRMGRPVDLEQFDLFVYFETLRLVATLAGLNTTDPCFDTAGYLDSAPGSIDQFFLSGCSRERFDQFVFFDSVHPTGRTHANVGSALYRAVR